MLYKHKQNNNIFDDVLFLAMARIKKHSVSIHTFYATLRKKSIFLSLLLPFALYSSFFHSIWGLTLWDEKFPFFFSFLSFGTSTQIAKILYHNFSWFTESLFDFNGFLSLLDSHTFVINAIFVINLDQLITVFPWKWSEKFLLKNIFGKYFRRFFLGSFSFESTMCTAEKSDEKRCNNVDGKCRKHKGACAVIFYS